MRQETWPDDGVHYDFITSMCECFAYKVHRDLTRAVFPGTQTQGAGQIGVTNEHETYVQAFTWNGFDLRI